MSVRADTKPLTLPIPGGRQGATVAVEPLDTGQTQAPPHFLERRKRFPVALGMSGFGTPRSKWNWLPTPAFIVHHPSFGPFLIDTGFHPSVASKPVENLGLMGRFARPRMEPGQDVAAQLRARKIDASKISLVVMTHLHFDHASAMSEFPGATFIVTEDEWHAASTVSRPLFHGYHRAQFDYAFDYRTVSYAGDEVSSYATFGRTIDLFGDGSVRLASTPGHSAGHQSVILRLADRDFVVAGDAVYTMNQLEGGPEPPRPEDPHNWRRSMRELARFHAGFPDAVIVPGHDPEFWPTLEKRYE